MDTPNRCAWAQQSEIEAHYHDQHWGMPTTDDKTLFEFIILEAAQAGLSWHTVLQKYEGYRHYYCDFDVQAVAKFDQAYLDKMLLDPAIIRHKLKLSTSVKNAKVFIAIQGEFGSFAKYLWAFVDNKPLQNEVVDYRQAPVQTDVSMALSKDLKKRGMSFVGPTIMYAYMQAIGMVNDHEVSCHCYDGCRRAGLDFKLPS
ncbi:MAG: DNA-3-methyladenine glycosylase I [Oceanospirillaceae bacterium]|nr:DNA-3-methyladenine glycosylase I [Oceanospirillaceae bacterium]